MSVTINYSFTHDKNRTYKIGDTFYARSPTFTFGVGILASLGFNVVGLVALHNGHRWNDGILVGDIDSITSEELGKIYEFELTPVDIEMTVTKK